MALRESHVRSIAAVHDDAVDPCAEFEDLYREHARDLESFVFRQVRDRGLAEDLVQETFLRAYRVWPTVDKTRPFGPWLRTIAMRMCIDTWRAQPAGRVVCLDVEPPAEAAEHQVTDPAEVIVGAARHNGVGTALDGLSAKHRRILVMKDSFGMRYEEIAKLERTTLAAIRCSLSVARRRFRERYLAVCNEGAGAFILLPLLAGLRKLKRAGLRMASAVHRTDVMRQIEGLGAQPVLQVSSGIAAIAVVIGTFPLSGHIRPAGPGGVQEAPTFSSDAAALETAVPVASHRRVIVLPDGRKVVITVSEPSGAAPASAPDDTRGDATTFDDGSTTPPESDAGPAAPDLDPNTPPQAPDHVGDQPVDSSPPADPDDVTEPNRNVATPEDARIFSFTASPDGSVVFASGRNRECALQANCPALLFRSDDGGANWTYLPGTDLDGGTVLLPPAYGAGDDRIFATSPSGVLLVSRDRGQSFQPAAAGASQFPGTAAISPAFDSGDPRIVVGAQPRAAQYSDDSKTIGPAPYNGLSGRIEPAFASRDLLIAGGTILDDRGMWRAAVYRCEGAVCSGTQVSQKTVGAPKIRLSPGFQTNRTVLAFTSVGEIFRSIDGGSSFTQLPVIEPDTILGDITFAGDSLVAITRPRPNGSGGGVYASTDGGSSWAKFADPAFASGATAVAAAGSHLFVGLPTGGVVCSTDSGSTWATRC